MHRSTSRAIALGARIRNARESRKLSQRKLARQLGVSDSLLSRSETGSRFLARDEVELILNALEVVGPERDEILDLAADTSGSPLHVIDVPQERIQLACLIDIEGMAAEIVNWSPQLVPGLLQVPGYTRSIMERARKPRNEIDARVALRVGRSAVLTRDDPVRYTAVIGEGVLSQRFGDPEVMREQLSHLLKMGAEPHVDLRVMPSATDWHPGHDGQFSLLIDDAAVSYVHFENNVSCLFVQEEDVVARYRGWVPRLLETALSREESASLITRHLDGLEGAHGGSVEEVEQER
ncbi:helix-turn-helix transcriptional regulator [Saccharothrix longispora]|uniref:helix-turn-helix domain-containing protein n=1 Tax=Saccharothrix longispora TaxID=33920 RepID=UPI0028FD6022|nr:helix-turn-helix transcriptional regulator [Saccharothrix longispora]MDU0292740.1 helix-turn-helix transcriptional regulator [Saccharothrix longispora]